MNEELIAKMVEALGDDAKQAFYIYLLADYGSLWLLIYLIYRGLKWIIKEKKI